MANYGAMGGQQRGYGNGGAYGDQLPASQDPNVTMAPAMVAPDVANQRPQGGPPPLVVVSSPATDSGGGGFFHPPTSGGVGGLIPQFPQMAQAFDGVAKRFPWYLWLIVGAGVMWWLQSGGFLRKFAKAVAA